ncbi:MAG: hypothetical protein COU09_02825 [Candidatus Harrisonbacteria bacterium CG10_big_fil_rev_8_21_14_0_10_44_23]|uniref:Uncharacterized protein n=1 Tax=Candidatus Harrisonbacteria bacterium CG10_big_fil_rev_8_21_14_0_10_44_23 TaxID=1974585 RepID=A0A2H0UPN7_9BACT|nr:MAG: hypothetical protein COU09_02825 [Candidatus Harrisonbacteria bacterium CG10_big_fil_rev_8_21_14_0_10_44_23]
MRNIEVEIKEHQPSGWIFSVSVQEGDEETDHEVELTQNDYNDLTGGNASPSELVEKSFEFLLDREPKESILGEFNLTEISLYFPEYEEMIQELFQ